MSSLENMLYVKAVAEAPAPGSPETTSVSAVGAVNGGSPSVYKACAPGKGVRKFYCDVHRSSKNGEGFRITYTTDGIMFKHVDDFTDIPVNSGDKLFVDVLPIQHTDGAIELLRRGVEVYYLRRLTLIKKKREELKLSKSTRGDIKILMSLEERWFRRVSEDFLTLRRMISGYRSLFKAHQQLLNKQKALSKAEKNTLEPAIKSLEVQMDEMAAKIAEEAGKRHPAYNRLVEELGIDSNPSAKEALAEIITYIDPTRGFIKTANYFGLFKGRPKIYNDRLRQALQRLTSSANKIPSYQLTAKMEKQTLAEIWRQGIRGRLAIPVQG